MDLDDEELKATRMMNGADRNSKLRVKNDIEVNEYVRTNSGLIFKVNEITYDEEYKDYLYKESFLLVDWKENIVKHSKQLIDLIEVGDIVNGYRVKNIINEGPCPSGKCVDIDSSKDSSECTLWEEDIQTILTKESYMANCYKVGEEDE